MMTINFFCKGEIMNIAERRTYFKLKSQVLDAYFDACRDFAIVQGYSHEQVMQVVGKKFENMPVRPVEKLMLTVIFYVLCGGWYPERHQKMQASIAEQIRTNGLEKLISEIPDGIQEGDEESEKEVFVHDLRILKFIRT
jgi:hypothetical protein